MKIKHIFSPSFSVVSKKKLDFSVYYFNEATKELKQLDNIQEKEINNRYLYIVTTIKDGYYLIWDNLNLNVVVKGKQEYCVFMSLLTNKEEDEINVTAYFKEGTKEEKKFHRLLGKIYYCNLSKENRSGWFEGVRIYPFDKLVFDKYNGMTSVTEPTTNQAKPNLHSTNVTNNHVSSNIEQPVVTTTIKPN